MAQNLIGLNLWKYWLLLPDYDLHNVPVFSVAGTQNLDPHPALDRYRDQVHDELGLLEGLKIQIMSLLLVL